MSVTSRANMTARQVTCLATMLITPPLLLPPPSFIDLFSSAFNSTCCRSSATMMLEILKLVMGDMMERKEATEVARK